MRVQHFYLVNIQLGRFPPFFFLVGVCTKEVFSDYQISYFEVSGRLQQSLM